MKIAIVTNLYPPYSRGGAEVVITRVVTELLAQGHEVSVITTRPKKGIKSFFPRLESSANEMIYRFYPLNFYHPLRDYKHPAPIRLIWHLIDMVNPINGLLVRRVIHDIQPDVVWTHNLKGIGLTIPWALKIIRPPHIHHVHDVQLAVPSGLLLAGKERGTPFIRATRFLYTHVCQFLFTSPKVVISPSAFLKTFYETRGFFKRSRVVVMPNPAPKLSTLERGRRSAGPLKLLFVGQLEAHKGIHFLIKSLRASNLNFELMIAGEGSLKPFVQQAVKEDRRINYVGFLAMDQLVKMFQGADALAVPSKCYENSPTVIYEALESGLPVVAANIGGVAELIKEGVNGYLFTPLNSKELIEKLRVLDQNKDRLREASDVIRETVAPYAIDKYAEQLVALFESCIAPSEPKVLS